MIDGTMVAMAVLTGDTVLNNLDETTAELTITTVNTMPIGRKDLKMILRIAMITTKEPTMGRTAINVREIIITMADSIIREPTIDTRIIEPTTKETDSRDKVIVDIMTIIHNEIMRTMPFIHNSGRIIVQEMTTITEKTITITRSKN